MKYVIGNLKNYMTYEETLKYIENINDNAIICPPTLFISLFLNKKKIVGLQDVSLFPLGAHTGEVMASQAKEMGIAYSIIGHSERRMDQNENDKLINQKVLTALKNNLKVILCIGDNKDEEKNEKLKKQIILDLKDVNNFNNIIIAYEPIWCIGTGITPSNEQIYDTTNYIKELVKENFGVDIDVLYGGSVNIDNINKLKEIKNISGFLIGKAATDYAQLNKIVDSL